jgi:hypothetical protein
MLDARRVRGLHNSRGVALHLGRHTTPTWLARLLEALGRHPSLLLLLLLDCLVPPKALRAGAAVPPPTRVQVCRNSS